MAKQMLLEDTAGNIAPTSGGAPVYNDAGGLPATLDPASPQPYGAPVPTTPGSSTPTAGAAGGCHTCTATTGGAGASGPSASVGTPASGTALPPSAVTLASAATPSTPPDARAALPWLGKGLLVLVVVLLLASAKGVRR